MLKSINPGAAFAVTLVSVPPAFAGDAGAPAVIRITQGQTAYTVQDAAPGILGPRHALDTPFSVNSYTGELLAAQQARTLNDVLKNDAAAEDFAMGGNFDHLAIRGIPLDTRSSFRRDGLPFPGLGDAPLEAVERVEVLHGVSGLLYGFDRPAGVVNYVSKRPSAVPLLNADAQAGNTATYAHLDAGGPLDNARKLRQRWNVAGEKIGDFTHAGDLERWMGSAALAWQASPDIFVELDADFQRKSLAAQPQLPLLDNRELPVPPDPRALLGQPWARYASDAWNTQARLNYRLDNAWYLTVQAAYADNLRQAVFPNIYRLAPDGEILDGDIWYAPDQRSRILSSQTALRGTLHGNGLKHELVAGVATYHYNARNLGYVWPALLTGNIYQPVYADPPEIPDPPPKRTEKNRQFNVFIADTVSLGQHWQILGGLRYVNYASVIYSPSGIARNDYHKSALTPGLAALFQPRADLSFYLSYAQGLEPGGLAPVSKTITNPGEPLPPLISEQYEAGVKHLLPSGLLLSAALFRLDIPQAYVNAESRYVQGDLQQHEGLEVNAQGPLSERLTILAGARWLDAGRRAAPADAEKRPVAVARPQANVFLEYRLPGFDGLSAHLGGYYRGSRYFDGKNTVKIPGYVRWDAGLRYDTHWNDYPLTWRLNVENLTGRFYWASAAWDGLTMGAPRTVKLSVKIEW